MSNGKRVRSLPWLTTRSELALMNEFSKELIDFAGCMSPSGAYNAALEKMYLETRDTKQSEELAKSCRFLAVIRRDHGREAFDMVVSSKSPRLKSTDKKGVEPMSKKEPKAKEKVKKATKEKVKAEKPSLPLEHITYIASVNGTFSRVKCIQKFKNDAENPVEAVYVFPMPDEATVISCVMRIGKKKVEAELKKREEARKEYEEAVSKGHYASLLEQERPNIFTMNVGGIEPGEKIDVEVDYVQRVPWQAGGGRFTIPLVVAPRFIPGIPIDEKPSGSFSPDTHLVPDASRITPNVAKEGVSYNADISVLFSPGFRCKLSCPSHSFVSKKTVAKNDSIEIKTGDILTDRDFILVYESLSTIPEVAVHAGSFEEEEFLLANIIPPVKAVSCPTDCVMLLDVSGSMSGAKIDGLRVLAKKILEKERRAKNDIRFGIMIFDSPGFGYVGYEVLHDISEIKDEMFDRISKINSRGGTELAPALLHAYRLFKDDSRAKYVLLITDGQTESIPNVQKDVRIIAAGIDTAVNDSALKSLARQTKGATEWFCPGEDFDAAASRVVGKLSGPVLKNIKVEAEGDVVGVSDVYEGMPASIVVRQSKASKIKISGTDPKGKEVSWQIGRTGAKECDFVAQVWAREFIRENQKAQEQIEASLKYNVICQHTSFVAVSLKQVPGKKPERVEIPVNLPVGWDYEAVFGPSAFMALTVGARGFGAGVKGIVSGVPRMRASVDSHAASLGTDYHAASLDEEICEISGPDEPELLDLGPKISKTSKTPKVPAPPTPPVPQIPTPVIPTPPIPQIPITPMRFTLDAKDIVDRMIGILVALAQGKRSEAEKAFKKLASEFSIDKASKLDPEKKAMAYYFACRLAFYGLQLSNKVMAKLQETPAGKEKEALSWYNLAKKEEGRPYNVAMLSGEAAEYVSWKFGKGEKPVSGEWSLVS